MPDYDRFSRVLGGAVLAGTCALSLFVPRSAEACGASIPELNATVPAEGESYPANAALLFWGYAITLDAVTVTVDGAPASFVPAPFAEEMATIARLVEPEPQAGQSVTVSGVFCEDCEPVTLTYTVSAPDTTPPEVIAAESFFTVYDHAPFDYTFGCDSFAQIEQTMYVHLKQKAPAAGEAQPAIKVFWDPDGAGPAGIDRLAQGPAEEHLIREVFTKEQLGGKDWLSDVCLEVTAIDSAGNQAEPFEMCLPCFFRQDDIEPPFGPPDEPQWTEADAVPGSACAGPEASTGDDEETGEAPTTGVTGAPSGESSDTSGDPDSATAGEDGPEKGCACDSDVGGGAGGGLLLLALGAGLARRRR